MNGSVIVSKNYTFESAICAVILAWINPVCPQMYRTVDSIEEPGSRLVIISEDLKSFNNKKISSMLKKFNNVYLINCKNVPNSLDEYSYSSYLKLGDKNTHDSSSVVLLRALIQDTCKYNRKSIDSLMKLAKLPRRFLKCEFEKDPDISFTTYYAMYSLFDIKSFVNQVCVLLNEPNFPKLSETATDAVNSYVLAFYAGMHREVENARELTVKDGTVSIIFTSVDVRIALKFGKSKYPDEYRDFVFVNLVDGELFYYDGGKPVLKDISNVDSGTFISGLLCEKGTVMRKDTMSSSKGAMDLAEF